MAYWMNSRYPWKQELAPVLAQDLGVLVGPREHNPDDQEASTETLTFGDVKHGALKKYVVALKY